LRLASFGLFEKTVRNQAATGSNRSSKPPSVEGEFEERFLKNTP
jgi:hypothetical protein